MEQIDFSACELEPIRHPGSIQPHGYLVAINSSGLVSHASENIGELLSTAARATLGLALADLLGPASAQHFHKVMKGLGPGKIHHEIWEGGLERYSLWVHERGARHIFEWERLPESEDQTKASENTLSNGLLGIRSVAHIRKQAELAAKLTSILTGFHRVLVYRFHRDWSGEVITEVRRSTAEPLLGHRYPASDIPAQARKLYLENLLRVLVDSNGKAISLLSLSSESEPLDLTMSQLRAMSPYHLEYLRNTKVAATATASLICDGKLWGLLSCQHEQSRVTAPSERNSVAQIAQVLSETIERTTIRAVKVSQDRVSVKTEALQRIVTEPSLALSKILFGSHRLRNMVGCCGTVVWTATHGLLRMGETPPRPEIDGYAARLLSRDENLFTSDSRIDLEARLGVLPRNGLLAGLMAVIVSRDPALILFWFRRENIQDILWGGDLNQPVIRDEQTGKLSPRRSFALYKQSVTGTASEWTDENIATALMIRDLIGKVGLRNEQLAQLIESGFSFARALVTSDSPFNDCVLDALGNGASLLVRTGDASPTLRYANQALLDLAEICSEAGSPVSDADTLLAELGLSPELLSKSDMEPQRVEIPTVRGGSRYFLVERKLAIEAANSQETVSLSALQFTDVTRSERAREALLAAEEKAEHLASVRSSFLANMSHEIRTPMNGILGVTELLQSTPVNAQQRQYLEVIQQSGRLLLSLVNNILDLSKIEASGLELEKTPFDLTAVVDSVIELLRPKATEKSIELSATFDSPGPRWFEGDSCRLQQVVLNLAGNSVKFTPSGHVKIHVHCEDTTPAMALISLSVADTGIGIALEQQSRVFDRFSQADSTTTRRHGGTGLGLAISRDLVHLMGGTINLSSEVGVGSTFTVSLPIKRAVDPGQIPNTERMSLPENGFGRRILVTEDNKVNQLVIEAMLRKKGFEVKIADSGLQALDFLKDCACDLILMDCQMPGLDGYETTARIRSMEGTTRRTPIVALTADALPENRQRCLDAGMDGYLAKPINVRDLWDTLRRFNCLSTELPPRQPSRNERYAEPFAR